MAELENVSIFSDSFKDVLWTQVISGAAVTLLIVIAFLKAVIQLINKKLVNLTYQQHEKLRNTLLIQEAWDQDRQPVVLFDLLPKKQMGLAFVTNTSFTIGLVAMSLGLLGPPNDKLSGIAYVCVILFLNLVALYCFSFGIITNGITNYLCREFAIAQGTFKEKVSVGLNIIGTIISWTLFLPLFLFSFTGHQLRKVLNHFISLTNPYQMARKKIKALPDAKPYDTFISYSSNDVLLARHITEQLIAGGKLPWFAEYCISADLWTTDEKDLNQLLDDGLQQSQSGIVFSSRHYEKSKWCEKEVVALVDPRAFLECSPLATNTSEIAKILKDIPEAQKKTHTSLEESMQHLCEQLNWPPLEPPQVEDERRAPDFDATSGWRVQLHGWNHVGEMETPNGSLGPRFQRFYGRYAATLNIQSGPVAGDQIPYQDGTVDDRKYRESMIDFVKEYSKKTGVKIAGAHLIFVGERGHFAATYSYGPAWIRKYSLNFALDRDVGKFKKGQTWEFVLTFGFHGPFKEFCRYAWCFDKVVESFEWHSERATFDFA